jgi:pSer/pThr/pTyr-binding forkhead associated (FHA) protein
MLNSNSSFVSIGRSENCSYIVLDPERKVSRIHLEVFHDVKGTFVIDKSTNGTYINGKRIMKDVPIQVSLNDLIMLANSYRLDLIRVINPVLKDSDKTSILKDFKETFTDVNLELSVGEKTLILNPDKTEIGEILSMDSSSFIYMGRSPDCGYRIDNTSISKKHCRVRLIDPRMIEIEDLNSTNGTFADGERIKSGERYRFTSAVQIRLGAETYIDLSKVFPGIRFVSKKSNSTPSCRNLSGNPISRDEKSAFMELEIIWREYQERQQKINNSGSGIALGGMAASSLLAYMMTGPFAIIVGVGGSLMARYISQQQTSKLRSDFTYEDMFLQIYACPRCKESFQKKPWITIRECLKCKIKFRQ